MSVGHSRLQYKNLLEEGMKKIIKIFFNPLIIVISSAFPWWVLFKFVLKMDNVLGISFSEWKIFLLLAYIIGVVFSFWIERSRSQEEKEEKVEKYFLTYGKGIIGYVVITFFIIIIFIIFQFLSSSTFRP